jgi:dihydrodiol dehydrogenase / D-xylose 1-dehydrogenase (NADP)
MLNWGILGTSFISEVFAKAITASNDSRITSVFGRDPSRLEAFAVKHSIARQYSDIDSLLQDAEIDVVYIGLPTHLHADATIKAARAGKAILSEKALATTTADGHAMIKAVQEAGVFFLEGLMYLNHPLMEKLSDILRSGVLGPVRAVSGSYAANLASRANPLGMGTIYNLGCYPVSLLHLVVQISSGSDVFRARKLQALGNLSPDNSHVRDAALVVRFEDGIVATLQSTDSFGNDFAFTVQGTKGSLKFRTNPWLPPAGRSVMELKIFGGETQEIVVESPLDAFGWQVKTVEKCLAGGAKEASRPAARMQDSLEILELLTEWEKGIFESLQDV